MQCSDLQKPLVNKLMELMPGIVTEEAAQSLAESFDREKVTCCHCINLMSNEGKKNELLSYHNAVRMAEIRSGHANVTVW